MALNTADGSQLWSQQLASIETGGNVSTVAGRRLAGATPSYSDGLVICPTGVGAIVAVELATRSLAWGFQYSSGKNQRVARIMVNQTSADTRSRTGFLDDGAWRDSTITIAEGTVLFTPVDRQELLCLDLLSGRPRWSEGDERVASLPRDDSLYIGCVSASQIILIGRDVTRSINLSSGAVNWATSTREFGRPSGRGYSDRDYYYLPTTAKRLLKIRMLDGHITSVVETNRVLGNLISYRGDIISHGADHLAAYPCDEPNRLRIEAAESNGDLTVEFMEIKAQLLLQEGNLLEATRLFQQVYRRSPSLENREVYFDSLTRLIRVDLASGLELSVGVRDELIASRGNGFLAALADGCIRNGDWEGAFDAVANVLLPIESFLANDPGTITEFKSDFDVDSVIGRESSIPTTIWVRSRLNQILSRCDASSRSNFVARFAEWMNQSRLSDSLSRLRLANTLGVEHLDTATIESLSNQLIAESNFAACQFLITESKHDSSRLQKKQRELEESRLKTAARSPWNRGLVQTAVLPTFYDPKLTSYTETLNRNQLYLKQLDGPEILREYRFYYFYQSKELQIVDRNGYQFAIFPLSSRVGTSTRLSSYDAGELYVNGSLVVGRMANNVFAFDLHRLLDGADPVLWYRNTSDGTTASLSVTFSQNIWGHREVKTNRRRGVGAAQVATASTRGICMFNKDRLVCVDAITGVVRWQKDNLPTDAELLGGDRSVLYVDSKRRTVTHYDLMSGGANQTS